IVIGLADPARPTVASDALRAGVFDVLPRPASARDLEALLANAKEQSALARNPPEHPLEGVTSDIVGVSPAMGVVVELAQRAAAGRCGILICGERGTGREMLARAIHGHSPNRRTPFMKVDCAAASAEEIELQLFGSLSGNGSGSVHERHRLERVASGSLIAASNGGILFIKNITEMSARVQARLVRILRDREGMLDERPEPAAIHI